MSETETSQTLPASPTPIPPPSTFADLVASRGEFLEPWTRWAGHADIVVQAPGGENTPSTLGGLILHVAELESENFDRVSGADELDDEDEIEYVSGEVATRYADRIIACVNACQGMTDEEIANIGKHFCAYCGQPFEREAVVKGEIQRHIAACPKHPLAQFSTRMVLMSMAYQLAVAHYRDGLPLEEPWTPSVLEKLFLFEYSEEDIQAFWEMLQRWEKERAADV